jgi:hypothetical protein
MSDQELLLAAFKAMDREAKEYTLAVAEGQALLWPAPKPAPHLRLVQVDRKAVSDAKRLPAEGATDGGVS